MGYNLEFELFGVLWQGNVGQVSGSTLSGKPDLHGVVFDGAVSDDVLAVDDEEFRHKSHEEL